MSNLTIPTTFESDDEEFVFALPEGEYEEAIVAIVPLEEGLAILDADEDKEDE